jgi:hypothetical protein
MRLRGLDLGLSQSGRLASGGIGGLGHWHAFVVNLSGSISLILPSIHSPRIPVSSAVCTVLATRGPATGHLFPLGRIYRVDAGLARQKGCDGRCLTGLTTYPRALETSPHIPTGFISH